MAKAQLSSIQISYYHRNQRSKNFKILTKRKWQMLEVEPTSLAPALQWWQAATFSSPLFSSSLLLFSSPLLFSFLLLQCDNEVGEEGFIPQSPPPSLQNPFSSLPRAWASVGSKKWRKLSGERWEAIGSAEEAFRKRLGSATRSEEEVTRKRPEANAS